MDVTQRRISIIARGVGRFTTRIMRREGIGASEFDLIQAVRCHPGITQAEVCQRLEIDKGAAARQFARLEAKGYLRRETNPADRRSRLLYATHKAEELKNSKAHLEELFYEWLLEPLNAQEQEELARLVGVRRETIGNLEKGRYNPSLVLAWNIAQVFGVSIEEIFTVEPEQQDRP